MAALEEGSQARQELLEGGCHDGTIIEVGSNTRQCLEEVADVTMEIPLSPTFSRSLLHGLGLTFISILVIPSRLPSWTAQSWLTPSQVTLGPSHQCLHH